MNASESRGGLIASPRRSSVDARRLAHAVDRRVDVLRRNLRLAVADIAPGIDLIPAMKSRAYPAPLAAAVDVLAATLARHSSRRRSR